MVGGGGGGADVSGKWDGPDGPVDIGRLGFKGADGRRGGRLYGCEAGGRWDGFGGGIGLGGKLLA